jgi:hypothetical protein
MSASSPARSRTAPSSRLVAFAVFLLLAGLASSAAVFARSARQNKPSPPAAAPTANLPPGQKLYLKDGTFELVRSYRIEGDRVRYYSVERSEWEDVPASLVDWDATKKAQAEEARRKEEALRKTKEEIAAERAAAVNVDASYEVKPGLFLPPGEGIYMVDQGGVRQLAQNPTSVKRDTGRRITQILVPVPMPSKYAVVLLGKHARLRTQSSEPVFYCRFGEAGQPQIALIRARIKGDQRQVEDISSYFGQQSEKAEAIPLAVTQVASGLFRLLPEQDLAPGEFVLAEMIPSQGMNLDVWDFGVDPPAKSARQGR